MSTSTLQDIAPLQPSGHSITAAGAAAEGQKTFVLGSAEYTKFETERDQTLFRAFRHTALQVHLEFFALPALIDIQENGIAAHRLKVDDISSVQVVQMILDSEPGDVVVILSPNCVLLGVLCAAARRGVKVLVVNSNLCGTGRAERETQMRKANVAFITLDEGKIALGNGRGILHLKMYGRLHDTLDDPASHAWAGTANLSNYGFFFNAGEFDKYDGDPKTIFALATAILAVDLDKGGELKALLLP